MGPGQDHRRRPRTAPRPRLHGLGARRPYLVRARYLTAINRWTTLRDNRRHVDTLQAATRGALSKSLLWREILCDLAVTDVASIVLADRYGCWAWLDLWRTGSLPFTRTETETLRTVCPVMTTALRARQAANFAHRDAGNASGPAVVVLDPTLRIRGQTVQAAEHLHRLNPPDPAPDGTPAEVPAIPAAAYNVAAQLVAREQGVDRNPSRSRVFLDHGGWVTLEADRIAGDTPPEDRDIVVTIEPSSVPDRRDVFARAHGLTLRENEVLGLLLRGNDTHAIAAELTVSEHTVNDHAKAILAKTGCATRQVLLARVTG